MYKLLKPILLRFLSTTGCKRLIVDLLFYFASDCLCTSLQIINHLQDCKKDFQELSGKFKELKSLAINYKEEKEIEIEKQRPPEKIVKKESKGGDTGYDSPLLSGSGF